MKRSFIFLGALLSLAVVLNAQTSTGDSKKESKGNKQSKEKPSKPGTAATPSQEEMEKAWNTYMTPSEAHKNMAKWDGEWNEELTFWMDANAAPMKSQATCVNRMILGGRYQESITTGNMNGMPFEGRSTMGYDNARKVYIGTWIDNMGTGIMMVEGKWDEASKSIILRGKMVDPVSGKEIKVREVFKIIDDNTQLMEMYEIRPGEKERKTMEVKYTRK